jgi:hypothetical protein
MLTYAVLIFVFIYLSLDALLYAVVNLVLWLRRNMKNPATRSDR